MSRSHSVVSRTLVAGIVALCASVATIPAHADVFVSGLGGAAGYGTNRLYLNDDGSSCCADDGSGYCDDTTPAPPIDISAAFPPPGLTFFGMNFTNFCLNNNGNIDFSPTGAGVSTFTPMAFPVASQRMIAPWWGDVDTRAGSTSDPDHDAVYWDVRAGQATVTWHNVGYFDENDDMQNDFQLVLRTFAGCGAGSFDVEFRYNRCEWVAGDASGGDEGHCDPGTSIPDDCTPAQAGFDAGDLTHYYALPGSLTESIVNLCTTSNIGQPGVWRFRIRGGELPCDGSGVACMVPGMVGACALGTTQCEEVAGMATDEAVCVANQGPSAERCDGVDNDCNGMVDDGMGLCPQNYICLFGSCQPVCVEGACFTNQTCTSEGACVDNSCLQTSPDGGVMPVSCPPNQRCSNGMCVDACMGIVCPMPSVCQSGGCVVPCMGVTCSTGEVCDQGFCQVSCMCRDCATGYACSPDGTCQPSDCIGLTCSPGQVCLSAIFQEPGSTAMCVDPCVGAVCPSGQYCTGGTCVNGVNPDGGTGDGGGSGGDGSTHSGDATTGDGTSGGDGAAEGGFGVRRSSCGCSVPGQSGSSSTAVWVALGAIACVLARRKRSR